MHIVFPPLPENKLASTLKQMLEFALRNGLGLFRITYFDKKREFLDKNLWEFKIKEGKIEGSCFLKAQIISIFWKAGLITIRLRF